MATLTDDIKCCMTCAESKDCPLLIKWLQENGDPMLAHYTYCGDYKKVEIG